MHDKECNCANCKAWFAKGAGSGRCGCTAPIDDHEKDAQGIMLRCPARKAVKSG